MKWRGYISFHRYSYNSMLSHLLPLDEYGFILHLKLWSGNRPQKHSSHHLIVLTKVCLSDQPIIACPDNKPALTIKAKCMTRHWVRHFLLNSGAMETRRMKKTAINELQWLYYIYPRVWMMPELARIYQRLGFTAYYATTLTGRIRWHPSQIRLCECEFCGSFNRARHHQNVRNAIRNKQPLWITSICLAWLVANLP